MKARLSLRPTLFWDVNPEKLGLKESSRFVIGRVLDFGNLKEWRAIKDFYGLPKIKKVAESHVFFDSRSANFWSMVLNIPFKKLRCTRKPSLKTPKAFSMRDELHLLKALTYFEDIKGTPRPKMIQTVTWEKIVKTIESKVKNYLA